MDVRLVSLLLFAAICGWADACSMCCPTFWTEFNGKCFRYFAEISSFDEAESSCNRFKLEPYDEGHLASVHTASENEFLHQLFKLGAPDKIEMEYTTDWYPEFFIGLRVSATGKLAWTDNSELDYTHFADGEPNNYPGSPGVTITAGDHAPGWWADTVPGAIASYVCMLPCAESDV